MYEDYVYYTDNKGKRQVYYKVISGESKKISKKEFEVLSNKLAIKVRKNGGDLSYVEK